MSNRLGNQRRPHFSSRAEDRVPGARLEVEDHP